MFDLLNKYQLYVLPLFSVDEHGICNCGSNNCRSPGKHPFFKQNWKLTASNNKHVINRWRETYKENVNWGVLTGRKSSFSNKYLTVIDVDDENHEIINSLPKTFYYSTGQGYHFWYWTTKQINNSVSLLEDGVDVRGRNGYVVIPPSKHTNGLEYQIVDINQEINNIDISFFKRKSTTNNLKKVFLKKAKISTKTMVKIPENSAVHNSKTPIWYIQSCLNQGKIIPVGLRNITLHRLLSSDRSKGACEEILRRQANKYRQFCINGEEITDLELSYIIASVLKYPNYRNLLKDQECNLNCLNLIKKYFIPTENLTMTLKDIRNILYPDFNVSNLITDQHLARHLTDLGFLKKRTSRGNQWLLHAKTHKK